MADHYKAEPQVGKPGHCLCAQVFGPKPERKDILTVEPTEDPAEATRIARVCADALNAAAPEAPSGQQAEPTAVVVKKSNCYTVIDGNEVLCSFAGPDAQQHAALFVSALASHSSERAPTPYERVDAAARSLEAAVDRELARREAERLAPAGQAVIDAAVTWYNSSHKDEPEHALAMAILRYLQSASQAERPAEGGNV